MGGPGAVPASSRCRPGPGLPTLVPMPGPNSDGHAGGTSFAARYGPWAVVAGASDGVGAAYAVGGRGPGRECRAGGPADGPARRDRPGHHRPFRERASPPVAVDLTEDDALATIRAATDGLEVGTLMYCAGGDPVYEPFLANPVEVPLALVQRNCVASMRLCHHFAVPMVERGHGAIVLVASGAGLAGGPNMVAYGASKAFDIVMAEGLWAELHPKGIDVLAMVLGMTDTPSLRKILTQRGVLSDPDDPMPVAGVMSVEDTVAEALDNLADGPTLFVGDQLKTTAQYLRTVDRNEAVRLMVQGNGGIMQNDRTPAT